MNTINVKSKCIEKVIEPGDLFIDNDTDDVYILAEVGRHKYSAINISNGFRWIAEPCDTIEKCVENLAWLGTNAKITITF